MSDSTKSSPQVQAIPEFKKLANDVYCLTPKTDSGLKEVVEQEYGHRLAVTPGGWKDPVSVFNLEAWAWEHEKSGELRNMVTKSAQRIAGSADNYNPHYTGADSEGREDHQKKVEECRKRLRSIGLTYQNNSSRSSAASVVRDSPRLIRHLSEWENKPWEVAFKPRLAGQPAYKKNLLTGETTMIEPQDLLVRSMGIPLPQDFNKDVSNCLAVQVIREIFEGSEDLVEYYGESLFGTMVGVVDKVINWVMGDPDTGKTTLSVQQRALFGGYWDLGDFSILEQRMMDDHRFTMGRFEYVRALNFDETGVERAADARKCKTLTSGNLIEFERKGIERNVYLPKLTPWVFSNYAPKLLHDDGAVANRLRIFKLKKKFTEGNKNKNYVELDFWLPHMEDLFLWAWSFRDRYLKYRLDQSHMPSSMRQDVDNNSYDNDWLGQALEEICEIQEQGEVRLADLYAYIKGWRDANGHNKLGRSTLKALLRQKGYAVGRGNPEVVKGLAFNSSYAISDSTIQGQRYIH